MIKVLLIEDNPDDVANVQQALNIPRNAYLDPFDVAVAGSLGGGLNLLKAQKFDVVLLDLGLPDVRHFEGLDRLKKSEPYLPVIVLTKQSDDPLIAIETINRGAQDYFSKGHLGDGVAFEKIIRYAIERKKNEEELVRARESALKASIAKSEFLSSVSHDIRTPLNSIIGVAELLTQAPLSEEYQNYVRMLRRASDNLLTLINDVLDLSKIESGQMLVQNRPFNLLASLDSILDIISTRAHGKGLELILRVDDKVPRNLVGDPGMLNQILVNLLSNAVKFTKQGEIILDVAVFAADERRPQLSFIVADTGMGIPADKLFAIFDSFTQLVDIDGEIKRQGSGLGLTICKRLTNLMAGFINVESELNQGSRFTVTLPFEVQQVQSTRAGPRLDLSGRTILVVDDNAAHALLLKDLLSNWGARVLTAKSAADAAEVARHQAPAKFDFGLLDLRMPGIAGGGLELVERLKEFVVHPVIMLPTNHRHGDIERLKAAGHFNYYFKPTKSEYLAVLLQDILSGRAAPPTAEPEKFQTRPVNTPLNILVVDDSEENRLLIEAFCKNSGFNLRMAEDGHQAVEKFQQEKFNLVLMDIQMPRMNGYEALSAIRNWEKNQKASAGVPVLALTAFALKEEAEKCLTAGFLAHVTKPITKAHLLETIRKYAV